MRRILPFAFLAVILGGCTAEQIARAEKIANESAERVEQARVVVESAKKAVAIAEDLAEKAKSAEAKAIVDKAKAALDGAEKAQESAVAIAGAAQSAVTAAKSMQAAGASSWDTIGAAIAGGIPGILAAIVAIAKTVSAVRALKQTVNGLDKAKASLDPETVDTIHATLASEQDESTKRKVWELRA